MSTSVKQKSVPYVHGFKIPTKLDIEKALRKFDDQSLNQGWASQAFSRVESSPSHFKMGPSRVESSHQCFRVESSYFNHLFLFS